MNQLLICLSLFLLLFACQNTQERAHETIEPNVGRPEPVVPKPPVSEIEESEDSINLDSLWYNLVFKKGGCLSGGQYFGSGGEGCVMKETSRKPTQWPVFFDFPKARLAHFLLAQLDDTATSRIHTCPCYPAIGSEVAVYALQEVCEKNWFALEGFEAYGERTAKGCSESYQRWLQNILKDNSQRVLFAEAWLREFNSSEF